MVRVLQVVTYMGRGGLETMLMNYYRNIDRDIVRFFGASLIRGGV